MEPTYCPPTTAILLLILGGLCEGRWSINYTGSLYWTKIPEFLNLINVNNFNFNKF